MMQYLIVLILLCSLVTASDFCDWSQDSCPEGHHCSGPRTGLVMTKCCPLDTQYNPFSDSCIATCIDNDNDGFGENCPAGNDCDDSDASKNPGALTCERIVVESEQPAHITPTPPTIAAPKIETPNTSLPLPAVRSPSTKEDGSLFCPHAWQMVHNSQCFIECPQCDTDNDGIQTGVEIAYYANPLNEHDTPGNRIFQAGCSDYYHPESDFFLASHDIRIEHQPLTQQSDPVQLGSFKGRENGGFNALHDEIDGIADLVKSVAVGLYNRVVEVYDNWDNLNDVLAGWGVSISDGAKAILDIRAREVWDISWNSFYDGRIGETQKIIEYESECNNVIFLRSYAQSYLKSYNGMQVALFVLPGKYAKAARLSKYGNAAVKGEKVFEKVGKGKWLSGLPDDVAGQVGDVVGKIAARQGDEVAGKASLILTKVPTKDVTNFARFIDAHPKLVGDMDKIKDIPGANDLFVKTSHAIERGEDVRGPLLEIRETTTIAREINPGDEITSLGLNIYGPNSQITEFDVVVNNGKKIYEISDKSGANIVTIRRYLSKKNKIYEDPVKLQIIKERIPLFDKSNVQFKLKVKPELEDQVREIAQQLKLDMEFVD